MKIAAKSANEKGIPVVLDVCGADGLCAISATVTKNNVKKEIKKFQKLFLGVRRQKSA